MGQDKERTDTKQPFMLALMSKKDRLVFLFFIILWASALYFFWKWWLDSSHIVSGLRLFINSILICWSTLVPGYSLFFMAKMKRVNPKIKIPEGLKVAMIITKTPNEPFSLVKKSIQDMLNQEYPHDTWLADEDPAQETIEWCKNNKVYISTRKNAPEYNQPTWPRKRRTKEGNLSYFYDKYGYENYDFVIQLDADHAPSERYLEEMLKPFIDPKVGYVAAPSICDNNFDISWSSKARAHSESRMHNPLNAGYNDGWAPLCTGSHYAVRTKALKEIGGLGPELAEDFTTSLIFQAAGWKGANAMDAEAHGHGPHTFPDLIKQDFQWAKSLTIILFTIFPKYFRKLKLHLKAQFLFSLLWYPLFGATMLTAFMLPIIALFTKIPFVRVNYIYFLLHLLPITICYILIAFWIRKKGWLRPITAEVISWQNFLFQFARWPWIIIAFFAGLFQVIFKRQPEYKVTPKNVSAIPSKHQLPFKSILPYFLIITVAIAVALHAQDTGETNGYYYFLLLNTFAYSALIILIVWRYIIEHKKYHASLPPHRHWVPKIGLAAAFMAFALSAILMRGGYAWSGIFAKDQEAVVYLEPPKILAENIAPTPPGLNYPPNETITPENPNGTPAIIASTPLIVNNETGTEETANTATTTEISTATTSNKYIVSKGDSLWKIAKARYGYGNKWKKILEANKEKIGFMSNGKQTLILPDQEMILPNQ